MCLSLFVLCMSLCPAPGHISAPLSCSPSVTPHIVVLAASQREGDVLKVIRADYFPVRRTHLRQTHAALHSIFSRSVCFCGSPESLMLAQKSVPVISAEPWHFFQAARKQSGYKRFWLLFFTRCVGLSGRKGDRFLAGVTRPFWTHRAHMPLKDNPFIHSVRPFVFSFTTVFVANRTHWLPCIVGYWSSSCSLVLWQFWRGKLDCVSQ